MLIDQPQLSILEMGFGTGLNALLTAIRTSETHQHIYYETFESLPLDATVSEQLNYCEVLDRPDLNNSFLELHRLPWNTPVKWLDHFVINKRREDFLDARIEKKFNLIYFDAFAPQVQPELWTRDVFQKLRQCITENGILVTYSSKTSVRKALQDAGFKVDKIQGPYGKREIVRAWAGK